MRQIKCPDCNETCIKHGVLKSGSQRWFCKHCKVAFTVKINNLSKELSLFLNWLFSTNIQTDMPGKGRPEEVIDNPKNERTKAFLQKLQV